MGYFDEARREGYRVGTCAYHYKQVVVEHTVCQQEEIVGPFHVAVFVTYPQAAFTYNPFQNGLLGWGGAEDEAAPDFRHEVA